MQVILVPITFSKSHNNESIQEIRPVMSLKTNKTIVSLSIHHNLHQADNIRVNLA